VREIEHAMLKGAGILVLLAVLGCGGTDPDASAPKAPLVRWEGQMRDLFDDQIDSAAVGLSLDGRAPQADPLLRLRTTEADIVARMRVQTVTRDTAGARTSYVLSMQVGQPTLMPPKDDRRDLELFVDQASSAFSIVSSLDTTMRGKIFIGFVRRFATDDGSELHWHLTADSQEVAAVIQEIAVLEDLARKQEQ
jgi:hypothetical protein